MTASASMMTPLRRAGLNCQDCRASTNSRSAGEPVWVGQQRRGRVRATPGRLGQRLGPGAQGGQQIGRAHV